MFLLVFACHFKYILTLSVFSYNTFEEFLDPELGWPSHVRIGSLVGTAGAVRLLLLNGLYKALGLVVDDKLRGMSRILPQIL